MKLKALLIQLKWKPFDVLNKVTLRLRKFEYGTGLKTYGSIFVRGTGTVKIGNHVTITSCRETNPIGGDTKTVLFAKGNGEIIIGNNVGMSNVAIVALDSVVIEDNVLLGGGCKIYDNDFHSLDYEKRMQYPDPDIRTKPIRIKQGAFIGAHTIILKGVTIGRHCVVGAGSVVTHSIPDGELWGGYLLYSFANWKNPNSMVLNRD